MPYILDEEKMVENTVFEYEQRIKSASSRFIDTTPVFVIYYHIDIEQTTVDDGFLDVESIIGCRSPIRFHRIKSFPLYGIEQIVLQLQDGEQGLDSSFESEAIVLPNTIKPLPNDFFIIPTLKDSYIFRIHDIQYDNVMPDNYYRISYHLEYIDDTKVEELDKQTNRRENCIFENIGTDISCIIKEELYENIKKVEIMYDDIKEFYKAMFYSERHNVFLGILDNGKRLYDPLQTEFINRYKLFSRKRDMDSLILTNQYDDNQRRIKYIKSIYKYIESKDKKLLSTFSYITRPGVTIIESSFHHWHDKMIEVLEIPLYPIDSASNIFSKEYIKCIEEDDIAPTNYANFIKNYLLNKELHIGDIPLSLNEELIYLNTSLEVFFFTPIIMYIIRNIIEKEIKK